MEYLQMRGYLIVCQLKRFSLVAMIRSNLLNSVNCTHIRISVSWKLFCYDTIQINWTRLFEYESQLSFLLEIFFLKRRFLKKNGELDYLSYCGSCSNSASIINLTENEKQKKRNKVWSRKLTRIHVIYN